MFQYSNEEQLIAELKKHRRVAIGALLIPPFLSYFILMYLFRLQFGESNEVSFSFFQYLIDMGGYMQYLYILADMYFYASLFRLVLGFLLPEAVLPAIDDIKSYDGKKIARQKNIFWAIVAFLGFCSAFSFYPLLRIDI